MKLSGFSIPLLLSIGALAAVIPLNEEAAVSTDVEPVEHEGSINKREVAAPLLRVSRPAKSRYIVVYNRNVTDDEASEDQKWIEGLVSHPSKRDVIPEGEDGELSFFKLSFFRGYAGYFDPDILNKIQNNPLVKFVEEDEEADFSSITTQAEAPYGLTRLSSRNKPTSANYTYDNEGGKGVNAYVLDSGVKNDAEFGDRVTQGAQLEFPWINGDILGHGTHVAGTIGSKSYGVAKQVNLTSVSIVTLLGIVRSSNIVKGFEFAHDDHVKKIDAKLPGFKGSTINLSTEGLVAHAITEAINAVTEAGIHVAVAAGNTASDACYSAAVNTSAIIVGAIDSNDTLADFSNFGKCVDIHAYGVDVPSVGILWSPSVMSGTSMATPHVTGSMSYLISLQPGLTSEFNTNLIKPVEFRSQFLKYATQGKVKGLPAKNPNRLAYTGGSNPLEFWGK
ncbi:uncharacterized protein CXQ87_001520 [Candidozyma duobushaemuli]|uniref:Uncharacterized protein n=2 Tax=Candidozyma TaxID=3303203 RepID=A0ABX8I5F6_9ASCO|nr:uncharacterized protein CXQ87_001520 [[Candida] duobushaemulonis]PVH18589.1 hypothetical protein CXQ87_001520 [[Candida] duobushaemulonis]QWU87110.1 hypothetical protein CA3LBN_001328 [[Candida] haemuloni]